MKRYRRAFVVKLCGVVLPLLAVSGCDDAVTVPPGLAELDWPLVVPILKPCTVVEADIQTGLVRLRCRPKEWEVRIVRPGRGEPDRRGAVLDIVPASPLGVGPVICRVWPRGPLVALEDVEGAIGLLFLERAPEFTAEEFLAEYETHKEFAMECSRLPGFDPGKVGALSKEEQKRAVLAGLSRDKFGQSVPAHAANDEFDVFFGWGVSGGLGEMNPGVDTVGSVFMVVFPKGSDFPIRLHFLAGLAEGTDVQMARDRLVEIAVRFVSCLAPMDRTDLPADGDDPR